MRLSWALIEWVRIPHIAIREDPSTLWVLATKFACILSVCVCHSEVHSMFLYDLKMPSKLIKANITLTASRLLLALLRVNKMMPEMLLIKNR
jgi:hypothetical protein